MSSAFLPLWWRLLKSEVWCELHSSNCELWRHCWCCRRHPRCLGRRRRLVRGGDGGAKVGGDDGEAVRVNTSHRGCQSRSQSSSPLPHFFSFLFFHGLFAAFLQAQLWGPTPPKTAGCWRSHTRSSYGFERCCSLLPRAASLEQPRWSYDASDIHACWLQCASSKCADITRVSFDMQIFLLFLFDLCFFSYLDVQSVTWTYCRAKYMKNFAKELKFFFTMIKILGKNLKEFSNVLFLLIELF